MGRGTRGAGGDAGGWGRPRMEGDDQEGFVKAVAFHPGIEVW